MNINYMLEGCIITNYLRVGFKVNSKMIGLLVKNHATLYKLYKSRVSEPETAKRVPYLNGTWNRKQPLKVLQLCIRNIQANIEQSFS